MITFESTRYRVGRLDGCISECYTLETEDGLHLKLWRYYRSTDTPAVLLLHGLSTSSQMFLGEEIYNMASYLLSHGLEDVWLLDWRGSNEYKKSNYNADHNVEDVAINDIPVAVELIQGKISNGLHIIAHCIGSMALSMALSSKRIKDLRSVVLANVSLFPKLNAASLFKLYTVPQFAKSILNVDHFTIDPDDVDFQDASMLLMQASNFTHNQCKDPTCRMLSLVWGSGHESTLFNHENFLEETHGKLKEYFGPVSISYFRHIQKMLQHSAVISADGKTNYLDLASNIQVPMMLAVGKDNRCWYDSIQQFHDLLQTFYENVDLELLEIPNYGHMDLFMGKNAHADVFPHLVDFLKRN